MARKKQKKSFMAKVGVFSYMVGFGLALAIAIISPAGLTNDWASILAVLGLIVGLLNITESEVTTYLTASVAFIIAAWAFMGAIGEWSFIKTFMHAIIVFTAPGVLVVSLKALFQIAKD